MSWLPDAPHLIRLLRRIEKGEQPLQDATELFWLFCMKSLSPDEFRDRVLYWIDKHLEDSPKGGGFIDPDVKEIILQGPEKVKSEFTRRLDRSIEPDLRFSTTLGRYLPYLLYLDNHWVESNINQIFPKEIEEHWQAAMEGYLLGGRVYSHIYDLLSGNNHYDKAATTDFPSDEIRKRLIHHLCIGYLLEREALQNERSPFHKCIAQWKSNDIIEMISFFWTQREYLVEKETSDTQANQVELVSKQKARILDFWRFIFEVLISKDEYTEIEEEMASDLARLSCYLETIDDNNIEWLKLSAKYVEKNFNASFFIEYLLRLCDVSVSQVGIVYLEMLEYNTPIYHQDHIRSIVTKLYEAKETEAANRICNIYGSRNFEFLRDIYESYNP